MMWFQAKTAPAGPPLLPAAGFPGARIIAREAKPAPNIAQLEEAAYLRGVADQRSANTESLAALEQRHQAELIAAEEHACRRIVEAEGARVAALVAGMPDRVVAGVLEVVAPVLRKVLLGAVQDRAISELGRLVRDLVTGEHEIAVTVTAPAELIEAVKSKLPHGVRVVKFVEGDIDDVVINFGDVELSAALEGWRQSISGGEL